MVNKIEISPKTIIFTFGLVLLLFVLYQIRDILFLVLVAFILMTALSPIVRLFERVRIPRIIVVFLVYALVFGVFGIAFAGLLPSLIFQLTRLITHLPDVTARVLPYWNIDPTVISSQLAPIGENAFRLTVELFSNVFALLSVMVVTFYLLMEREKISDRLSEFVGVDMAGKIMEILVAVETRLGGWVLGQFFLMVVIGLVSYIGLLFLGIDYALPLAIIAGLLEIIPTIGPIVSSVPAILIALSVSPLLAASVGALYFLIHQTENQLLVPVVMNKSVGLSPIITILALMIGGKLMGIGGAILAVPIVISLQTIVLIMVRQGEKKKSESLPRRSGIS